MVFASLLLRKRAEGPWPTSSHIEKEGGHDLLPVYSRESENCDHLIHPPFSRRNETRQEGMVSASLSS